MSRNVSAPCSLGCKNAPEGYSISCSQKCIFGITDCFIILSFHVMRIASDLIAALRNSGVKYGTDDVIATSIPLSHSVTRHDPEPIHGNFDICGKNLLICSDKFGHLSICTMFFVPDSKNPNLPFAKQKSARLRLPYGIHIGSVVAGMRFNSSDFSVRYVGDVKSNLHPPHFPKNGHFDIPGALGIKSVCVRRHEIDVRLG
jgi:hypothetical protein